MKQRTIIATALLSIVLLFTVSCVSTGQESETLSGTYNITTNASHIVILFWGIPHASEDTVSLTFDGDTLTVRALEYNLSKVFRYELGTCNSKYDGSSIPCMALYEDDLYISCFPFERHGDCIPFFSNTACKTSSTSEFNNNDLIKYVGISLCIIVCLIIITSSTRKTRRYGHIQRQKNISMLTTLLILSISGFIVSLVMHYWVLAICIFIMVIVPILLSIFLRKSLRWLFKNWRDINPFSWWKNRLFRDKADDIILKALKNIDSLNRHFRDEEEANQQLFVSLKALSGNMPLIYQPRYHGENIGDIQIGNIVIEGKLDLFSKSETDRLLGQIDHCCHKSRFKMRIVIYGILDLESRKRILRTARRYPKKRVFLIYLRDPNRRRRWY